MIEILLKNYVALPDLPFKVKGWWWWLWRRRMFIIGWKFITNSYRGQHLNINYNRFII